MDGPHLRGVGDLCTNQAVLFKTWMKDPDGHVLCFSNGYRMGVVVGGANEDVVTLRKGDRDYMVRREWVRTHPDMVWETRSRKLGAIGLGH